MTYRSSDGRLWEFNRAGFGLTVLPTTFTRIVKQALGTTNLDMVVGIDDTLVSIYISEEDLATLKSVFTKLLAASLLVNFIKCTYAVSYQELLSMVTDSSEVRLSPYKIEAITKIPHPTNV